MGSRLKEHFADVPEIAPGPLAAKRNPDGRVWGLYDVETDDFLVIYNEDAYRGTYIREAGGFHVVVHAETDETVGFYIEGWVRDYVRQIPALAKLWKMPVQDSPKATPISEELWEFVAGLSGVPVSGQTLGLLATA